MNMIFSQLNIVWTLLGLLIGVLLTSLYFLSKNNRHRSDSVYWQSKTEQLQEQLDNNLLELDAHKDELRHLDELKDRLDNERVRLLAEKQEQIKNYQQLEKSWQDSRQLLQDQFNVLATKIFQENREQFIHSNKHSLDAVLVPLKEQINDFRQRIDLVHQQSIHDQAVLQTQIKNVLDVGVSMSQEADNLVKALKGDKKLLGNWGEVQLERSLQQAGLVKNEHYSSQARYNNDEGDVLIPDFVIYLPDQKQIVIDSKVSLVSYALAIEADNDAARHKALDEHVKAIRNHVKQLAEKNYPHLKGMNSPGFVLMFLPIEAAYIEAIKHDTALFDYAANLQVMLVSHTTLIPVLKTAGSLWNQYRSQQYVSEISDHAADIYNQVAVLIQHLQKIGNSLNSSVQSYNDSVTSLTGQRGLLTKVQGFTKLANKANKTIPILNTINPVKKDLSEYSE